MYIFWNLATYDVALRCLQAKVLIHRGLFFKWYIAYKMDLASKRFWTENDRNMHTVIEVGILTTKVANLGARTEPSRNHRSWHCKCGPIERWP